MRYLPTGNWMHRADAYTIQEIGLPSMVLMERAALAAMAAMEREGVSFSRALVVCGSGNNGGDGFAVARLMKERGFQVEAAFVGRECSMSAECRQQRNIAEKCGVPVVTTLAEREYTVIVDAVFGVGLNREIEGALKDHIDHMNRLPGKKVALDIPSGICSATGRVLGTAFRAGLTVCFACEKLGCVLHPGSLYAGKTVTADVGISKKPFLGAPEICYTFDRQDIGELLPVRMPDSHKGTYGRVLMVTGSEGMAGAAYLSAKGAYLSGAGLVQIYTHEDNRAILQQLLPEAIVCTYTKYDKEVLQSLMAWADVACLGCGLGKSRRAYELVEGVVSLADIPLIIDADGINILAENPGVIKTRNRPVILTPHMKEMAGVLGCSAAELKEKRFEKVQEFTNEYNAVLVLKDARTIVGQRGRQTFVNTAGNSAMAKAGSGDVLAGVIAGLLAQKLKPYEGAVLGVYLHALGGDEAKASKGSYSVLAEDLLAGLGVCLKKTEENRDL